MGLGHAEVRQHSSWRRRQPFPQKVLSLIGQGCKWKHCLSKEHRVGSNRAGVSIRASHNLLNGGWHHFYHGAKSCSASVMYREGNPTFPAYPCVRVRVWGGEILPGYLEAACPSLGAYTCSLSLLFSLVMRRLPGAMLKYRCLNELCFGHA